MTMPKPIEYKYDVCISSRHTDDEWIKDKLLSRLEKGNDSLSNDHGDGATLGCLVVDRGAPQHVYIRPPLPLGEGGGTGQDYSTVTDLARLRGWSMSHPRSIAQ